MPLSNIDYGAGQDQMLDVFDKTNLAIDAINDISYGATLATNVVQIGDWNMDANNSVNVAHGLADISKLRAVSLMIRNDANTLYSPHAARASGGVVSSVYISQITTTNIALFREDSSDFDSTDYDSTSYNRGWVTITYEK